MGRRKRPYVPKTRGCHECSQRRINCDKAEPNCGKCISKGLECSGLGGQYRFHNHFVVGNGGIGFKIVKSKQIAEQGIPNQGSLVVGAIVKKEGEEELVQGLKSDDDDVDDLTLCNKVTDFESLDAAVIKRPILADSWSQSQNSLSLSALPNKSQVINSTFIYEIPPTTLMSWELYFFTYFSNRIASEMVLIDDHYNGWRSLILPIAQSAELVRDAVMSAAASHYTLNVNDQRFDSRRIYAKVIHHLYKKQDLRTTDKFGKQIILLTLLILLTTMMVNGSSDFPTIARLLESALEVSGGEEALMGDELGLFLVRQIRKLRGYAAPFLSERSGLERLSLTAFSTHEATNGWDDFRLYCRLYPDLLSSTSFIYEINRQACEIYVRRASSINNDEPPMNDLVEKFIQTLEMAPIGYPGRHTTVFATFLVAAESNLPHHQIYFTNSLMDHYRRNGFGNILTATEYLKKIWATPQNSKTWTKILPELGVFIV